MGKDKWVVLDASKQEMRCNHCKSMEPLAMIQGKRLDFAVGVMKAFADSHKGCKGQAA